MQEYLFLPLLVTFFSAYLYSQEQFDALGAETVQVRLPEHLEGLDGLVIPGGESTTIGKLATEYKLIDPLRKFASKKPTWGTCAGMIFLAKDIGIDSQPILGLMDISVNRNAFGRQVDSFETDLTIAGIQSEDVPFHAVFIRAPLVTEVTDDVTVLAQLDNEKIVAVEQGHLLATAFHPELTDDNRIHAYFYDMVTKEID
ncbi:MAG: pyridoxal 5'-phosphate synthase glutaminase subunit PdxT [Chloroflexota bacterium]